MSIRGAERLTQVHRNTILSILEGAGEKCTRLLDQRMVNLQCDNVELDEQHTFVFCKQWRTPQLGDQFGDWYVFISLCPKTKLILNYLVAKRTQESCDAFVADLRKRIVNERVQISTDCWRPYVKRDGAIYKVFGDNADFATIYKQYGKAVHAQKFCPKIVTSVHKKVIFGNPNHDRICTSYVERQNLNMRLFNKRFCRASVCYSKKLANLKHSVAMFIAYHNFCRIHTTLKITPAMAAGLTDKKWTIKYLLEGGARTD